MSDSEKDRLYKIRHSVAHVMAQAVLERYPDAKLAIGPPIDDGFYYDFDLGVEGDGKPRSFSPDDLRTDREADASDCERQTRVQLP